VLLGDPANATDNLIYDTTLKPGERTAILEAQTAWCR
jgi:hypothetical protein